MKILEYLYAILCVASVAAAIYSFPNAYLSFGFAMLWFVFMELLTREFMKECEE